MSKLGEPSCCSVGGKGRLTASSKCRAFAHDCQQLSSRAEEISRNDDF